MSTTSLHEIFDLRLWRQDVTGHRERRARQLLGLEERQFRALIENVPIGFALAEVKIADGVSRDSRVIYANREYERHMGVPRETVVGYWMSELMPGRYQKWLEANDRMFRSGLPVSYVMYQHLSGLWTEIRQFPISGGFVGGYMLDVTARHTEQRDDTLVVDGLQISFSTRRAFLDGRDLELTRTEFEVLSTLARANGVVCRLTDVPVLYGADGHANERGKLDVHISRLRRKLGESAGSPRLIHTVRGLGYWLGTGTAPAEAADAVTAAGSVTG